MKKDYTHITVILDRTGSMESIREDTIGGFNAFLKAQKDIPGKGTLTLVQFDSQDPYEVIISFVPLKEVPELTRETYVPRASTPLLDAMGRGINDLEERLKEIPKKERPSKVVLAVVTDGQENASREFRREQIVKMIKKHQDKDDWQFVFLSADLAAIKDAQGYGVKGKFSKHFQKDKTGISDAWLCLSENMKAYRGSAKADMSFPEEDRKKQAEPTTKKK